jgi:hypothetical protein
MSTVSGARSGKVAQTATPSAMKAVDQQAMDLSGLNLDDEEPQAVLDEPPPKVSIAREKVLEEARKVLESEGKKGVSLVVIGKMSISLPWFTILNVFFGDRSC